MSVTIKAGDMIKSYDFSKERHPGCYMIGLVESVEDNGYINCKMVKEVFNDIEDDMPSSSFRTLAQGVGRYDHLDTRIELVATQEDLELIAEEFPALFA